jgi:diguanylate cyclase (GGDEF)-like protein
LTPPYFLPDQLFEDLDDPFIVKPLFFDKIQFGYAVVSANENASYFIDDLGPEISHYLESIYLAHERETAQKKLSETLESLVLTNRKLNALTVKENLDRLNNLRQLAANMLQSRKAGNGDYFLILVEIDNFYEINNEYGFAEGENLVNTVSQLLASSIRDDDFLSHQSCERYVILVKNAQGEAIEAIEKRFRTKLAACNANHERPYTVSMTWGYASAKIDSDFDSIYQEAEANLMKKKYQKFLTLEPS